MFYNHYEEGFIYTDILFTGLKMEEIEATINGKQEKALELMMRVVKEVEVAKRIGVTRQTISNWRHKTLCLLTLWKRRRPPRGGGVD